jgi:hypothetical protein
MMSWSESPVARLLSRTGSREVVETAIGLSKQQETAWEPIRGARIRGESAKQKAKRRPRAVPHKTNKK